MTTRRSSALFAAFGFAGEEGLFEKAFQPENLEIGEADVKMRDRFPGEGGMSTGPGGGS